MSLSGSSGIQHNVIDTPTDAAAPSRVRPSGEGRRLLLLETSGRAAEARVDACRLDRLLRTHRRLCASRDTESADVCYGLDTRGYLTTSWQSLDRCLIADMICAQAADVRRVRPAADSIVADPDVMADYFAMVRQSVEEQAMATMARVCAEQLPSLWHAEPSLAGHTLMLGPDAGFAAGVWELLDYRGAAVPDASVHSSLAHTIARVHSALYAVDRAFKAAAIVLLSADLESDMAALIGNELMAESMA